MAHDTGEQLEQFARMTNYQYSHQIQASQSDEERHWWQSLMHCIFQRHQQTETPQEEEEHTHEA